MGLIAYFSYDSRYIYMDRSTNIELDIDHGITLLLCLLGHDPQHDLYYGHGTGAPRAKATYNNEMGGIAPRGPGEELYGPYEGGMNGGLKDANQDIITIQAESEKAYDIQFMLKYAYGALRNYSENIFINIDVFQYSLHIISSLFKSYKFDPIDII